jgi:hypothetical protein
MYYLVDGYQSFEGHSLIKMKAESLFTLQARNVRLQGAAGRGIKQFMSPHGATERPILFHT